MIVFRTILSLEVSRSVKYTFRVYFWCFWCPCFALVVMSNRWNQYNFSTLHRLCILLHRWILVLLLIFVDWYKHSNTDVAGSKCISNRYWYIIWRLNAIFLSKWPHYIMGYIIHLGSMFFLFSLVLNLAYIDYSLCQIWSVHMHYLRRCDHSNNCLFLVIQRAEVLLNFFGECRPCPCGACAVVASLRGITNHEAAVAVIYFPLWLIS